MAGRVIVARLDGQLDFLELVGPSSFLIQFNGYFDNILLGLPFKIGMEFSMVPLVLT